MRRDYKMTSEDWREALLVEIEKLTRNRGSKEGFI